MKNNFEVIFFMTGEKMVLVVVVCQCTLRMAEEGQLSLVYIIDYTVYYT